MITSNNTVHRPRTYKVYSFGKVTHTIEFLDDNGKLHSHQGGHIHKSYQGAWRMADRLNHPIKYAIKRYGMCVAYHDGYTAGASVEDDGYKLWVQLGAMPPHYSETFATIEEVEEEMRERSGFPVTVAWRAVKPEEI